MANVVQCLFMCFFAILFSEMSLGVYFPFPNWTACVFSFDTSLYTVGTRSWVDTSFATSGLFEE